MRRSPTRSSARRPRRLFASVYTSGEKKRQTRSPSSSEREREHTQASRRGVRQLDGRVAGTRAFSAPSRGRRGRRGVGAHAGAARAVGARDARYLAARVAHALSKHRASRRRFLEGFQTSLDLSRSRSISRKLSSARRRSRRRSTRTRKRRVTGSARSAGSRMPRAPRRDCSRAPPPPPSSSSGARRRCWCSAERATASLSSRTASGSSPRLAKTTTASGSTKTRATNPSWAMTKTSRGTSTMLPSSPTSASASPRHPRRPVDPRIVRTPSLP